MTSGHLRSQSPWLSNHPEPYPANASSSVNHSRSFHFPAHRFAGDGLDYRSPRMSQNSQTFIDLTGESELMPPYDPVHEEENATSSRPNRPSRVQRDVVDLERPFDQQPQHSSRGIAVQREPSPDVQVLYSRPIPAQTSNRRLPLPVPVSGGNGREQSHFLSHRTSLAPYMGVNDGSPALEGLARFTNATRRPQRPMLEQLADLRRRTAHVIDAHRERINPNASNMPIGLNFEEIGFAMAPQAPPPPTYSPPPAASDGFTRSPTEDDIVICPNCEDELGAGDEDIKRQVWVVRSCGHVYCGECTKNRSQRGRGRQVKHCKTKPFAKCVVDRCGKPVASKGKYKGMLQVYL